MSMTTGLFQRPDALPWLEHIVNLTRVAAAAAAVKLW